MPDPVIIATRESRLALWQAEHVRDLLTARFGLPVSLLDPRASWTDPAAYDAAATRLATMFDEAARKLAPRPVAVAAE